MGILTGNKIFKLCSGRPGKLELDEEGNPQFPADWADAEAGSETERSNADTEETITMGIALMQQVAAGAERKPGEAIPGQAKETKAQKKNRESQERRELSSQPPPWTRTDTIEGAILHKMAI